MRLPEHQWSLLRDFINNALSERGLVERHLAVELSPWLSKATLNRLAKTGTPTPDQANVLLNIAGRLLEFDPVKLKRLLDDPCSPDLVSELELASANCFECTTAGMEAFELTLTRSVNTSQRLILYSSTLPAFMTDGPFTERRLHYVCKIHRQDSRDPLLAIRKVARQSRFNFMNYQGIATLAEVIVLVPLSALIRLALQLPPYEPLPAEAKKDPVDQRDEVRACFDSIKYDALDRGVALVILNDLVRCPAQTWVWNHIDCGMIALFDCGTLLSRRIDRLAYRYVQAERNPFAGYVYANRLHELESGQNLACNGADTRSTVRFLDAFLRRN